MANVAGISIVLFLLFLFVLLAQFFEKPGDPLKRSLITASFATAEATSASEKAAIPNEPEETDEEGVDDTRLFIVYIHVRVDFVFLGVDLSSFFALSDAEQASCQEKYENDRLGGSGHSKGRFDRYLNNIRE